MRHRFSILKISVEDSPSIFNQWLDVHGESSSCDSRGLHLFSIAVIRNHHKLPGLNNANLLSYTLVDQSSDAGLPGLTSSPVSRAGLLSGGPRENPFSCPFQLPKAAHIPLFMPLPVFQASNGGSILTSNLSSQLKKVFCFEESL